MVLWHEDQPIGICIFGFGPLSSSGRNRAFGLAGRRLSRQFARQINRDFASVSRLVLDPRYRGAGLAAAFLRRCCQLTDWPWIELTSSMADLVPFCEAAGFRRIATTGRKDAEPQRKKRRESPPRRIAPAPGRRPNRGPYGRSNWTDAGYAAYLRRSRFTRPAYFLFDNRRAPATAPGQSPPQ